MSTLHSPSVSWDGVVNFGTDVITSDEEINSKMGFCN